MQKLISVIILSIMFSGFSSGSSQTEIKAGYSDSIWTLEECINYALVNNIQVRKSELTNRSSEIYISQAESAKLPSLDASVFQGFDWTRSEGSGFSGTGNTSYSVNSGATVYNGQKLTNRVKQAELDFMNGVYSTETLRESISISVLNAFLQVLYAMEQVSNSENQMNATREQLNFAAERLTLGIISRYEYQQVVSQLANENYSLELARNQLIISRVNLMQLMELPVDDDFAIEKPDSGNLMGPAVIPDAEVVYNTAMKVKPQVKSAALSLEAAILDESIARADLYPRLTVSAGVGTGYSGFSGGAGYFNQLDNRLNPSIGLSLSIPIFQKNIVRSNISIARIGVDYAGLESVNVSNQLRKEIEQASVDVISMQAEYEAGIERFSAMQESFELAEEKFINGMINSVDYLFEKTNLIVAESELLQTRYSLVFGYRILDFYMGKELEL